MKLVTLVVVAFLTVGLSTAQAEEQNQEKEIQVSINDALVPSKVKAYESVRAVISGLFPNGCYRYSHTDLTHSANNSNVHKVRTFAKVTSGMCIMVLVPFTKEVDLGSFAPGEHHIRFENSDETYMQKTIIVE